MLEQKLNELEQSDIYPFHMPGHKRAFLPFANPYAIDITEIEGFDNLHHATGILQEAQQKAKQYITRCICGSWFLFICIRKIPPTASRGR